MTVFVILRVPVYYTHAALRAGGLRPPDPPTAPQPVWGAVGPPVTKYNPFRRGYYGGKVTKTAKTVKTVKK